MAAKPDPLTPIGSELAALAEAYDGPPFPVSGEVFPANMAAVLVGSESSGGKLFGGKPPGAGLSGGELVGGKAQRDRHANDEPFGDAPARGSSLAATAMFWGFPGFAAKKGQKPRPLINARAETAATLKTWRGALAGRRCLIPARGFFEWGPPGRGKRKYFFSLPGANLILMAGLWGEFEDGWPRRFSILTTAANDSMADIHDRMPVIVREPEIGSWLFGDYAAIFDRREVTLARSEAIGAIS